MGTIVQMENLSPQNPMVGWHRGKWMKCPEAIMKIRMNQRRIGDTDEIKLKRTEMISPDFLHI